MTSEERKTTEIPSDSGRSGFLRNKMEYDYPSSATNYSAQRSSPWPCPTIYMDEIAHLRDKYFPDDQNKITTLFFVIALIETETTEAIVSVSKIIADDIPVLAEEGYQNITVLAVHAKTATMVPRTNY